MVNPVLLTNLQLQYWDYFFLVFYFAGRGIIICIYCIPKLGRSYQRRAMYLDIQCLLYFLLCIA